MPEPKGDLKTFDSKPHPQAGVNLLFLREEEIRAAQDLLFFAYRDFTNAADVILEELGLGRAHHRALHFIGRNAGMSARQVLDAWFAWGEDVEVIDAGEGAWRSSTELAAFADRRADAEERDWRALDPRRDPDDEDEE